MRGRKPNLVACVNCRQMKLACDRNKQFPSACSRCAKTNKVCSVDPSFRRENKRKRLEEVEQELEQIKRDRADQRQPQRPNPDNIELADVPVTDTSVIEVSPDVAIHSNGKAIGMVHVPSTLIGVLLDEYFTHYDALCPILPRVGVFVKYSDSCPLLFWTVLVTAMRRKSEHRELYSSLVDVVQTMAFEAASPQHKSLLTLQGLLLLCYWPLPFRRNEDPSHSLLAIATHLGLRLGLHRPHHRADFEGSSSEDNTTTILKRITWVVCFITNVSLSAQLGLPPTARLDPGLLEILAAKPRWLPDTLYFQLHLARRALSITLTLGCSETSATGLLKEPDPFIRNFETDFQALDYQFSPSWSPADQILFLGCRIMLYTFALADRGKWKDSLQHETSSHWLIRAYLTATTTIQAASSMKSYLIYAPARLHKILMNAICFLLLLKVSRHQDLVDRHTVSNAISCGWEMMQALSVIEGDFMSRACALLDRYRVYCDVSPTNTNIEDLLAVQSRMGANITFSTAMRARACATASQGEGSSTAMASRELGLHDMQDTGPPHELDWTELFDTWLDF